jgi:hypothetical protein
MPEFHSDSLVPQKHGVLSPFAKFTWCVVVAAGVAVISLFVFKFDLERLRGSAYFIDKIHRAIESKDWPAAMGAMNHVQGRDREKPDFLRVVADFLEATQSEPAVLDSILSKLDAMGLMLPADYIWACRLQLTGRKINLARKALDRIPASTRSGAEALKLSVAILNEEGRHKEAKAEEAKLFQLFPEDPEVILRVAVRDLAGTFPEFQQAALQKLWALAEQPNESGLNAIRVLTQQSNLTLAEATHLLDLVGKQPNISPAERLGVVSVILRLDPARREELINAEVKRYRSKDVKILAQVASWLAQEKEYDRLMALAFSSPSVSKDALLQTPEIFPMVAMGLAEQERWGDLLALLKQGKKTLPVPKARAAAWRALATKNLDPEDTRETRFHLEEALREGNAEKNHSAVFETARLAEDWGMPDLALKAYEALAVPRSTQEQSMLEKSLQMAVLLKDSTVQLTLSERLAALLPSNRMLAHRRDYLKLLLGTNIETTATTVDSPSDATVANSNSIQKLLDALRAYRLHDRTLAFAVIRTLQDTDELTSGERAVYAGILAESGETRKAYDLGEKIRPELLLNEEIAFLNKAL